MKTRPILFSAPMVRALLEGRKTQTRRIVKHRHPFEVDDGIIDRSDANWPYFPEYVYGEPGVIPMRCPYGVPGDRLWVKETHAVETNRGLCHEYNPPFSDGRPVRWIEEEGWGRYWEQCHYRATDEAPQLCCERSKCKQCSERDYGPHWKPSIHMRREYSRLTLEVTEVRIERVQDISEADARAEGVEPSPFCKSGRAPGLEHVDAFEELWCDINGAESWDANPWVWVVSFRKVVEQ